MIRCTRLFDKALRCSHYVNVSSDAANYDQRTNTEYTPLLPEGIKKNIFKRKPADVKQRQRFLDLKKDVIQWVLYLFQIVLFSPSHAFFGKMVAIALIGI